MNRLTIAFCTIAYLLLVACGGGDGIDKLQPPIAENPNTLLADAVLPTVETIDGGPIQVQRDDEGPFATCGRIKELRGYRTDTEIVFRIEDEFGFCWENDVYSIWLPGIRWRGVPATMIISNDGDPMDPSRPDGIARIRNASAQTEEPAIHVRQWMDDPADGFFYLSIPLDIFSFANKADDAKSVFNVYAEIDRFTPLLSAWTDVFVRDFTDPVAVDFVDPN